MTTDETRGSDAAGLDEIGTESAPAPGPGSGLSVGALRLAALAGSVAAGAWAYSMGASPAALPALGAAVVLMALAFWRLPERSGAPPDIPRAGRSAFGFLRRHWRGLAIAAGLAASVGSGYLEWSHSHLYIAMTALWLAGIALVMIGIGWPRAAAQDPAAPCPERSGWWSALRRPSCLAEILVVLVIGGLSWAARSVALATTPLVVHGDEGEFGIISLGILNGTIQASPFSTVWLGHPSMFNYLQAGVMAVFGTDVDGLRLLSAIVGTASVLCMYGLMRLYAGRAAAVTAAVLMGISHLHVHFSRMALNNIESAFFVVLVVLLLAIARQRRSPAWYAWAGLACGYSLYFYYGSRIIPFVAAALLAYVWRERKLSRWDAAAFGMALAVAIVPLAAHYISFPPDFGGRVQGVFLFTDQNLRHTTGGAAISWLDLLARQIQRNLLFFVRDGDASAFYLRDLPAFDPVTAFLFWAGMAVALVRVCRYEEYSLLAWFWPTVLVGGVLTNDAPNAPRLLLAVPAVFAFAGLFASRLRAFLGSFVGSWSGGIIAVLIVAASVLSAGINYDLYLVQFAAKAGGTGTAVMAREMRTWEDKYTTYLLGAPLLYAGHGTIRFIARDAQRVDAFGPQDYLPLKNPAAGALFIVLPHRSAELARIQETYPGGAYAEFRDGLNRLLFVSYRYPQVK